ncbi:MAG TPA: hypothetical protein DHV30_14100 [Balneola sp.]|mgnify:CR=1 FL=1|nr:hypothetical protein [Balneola sp.]
MRGALNGGKIFPQDASLFVVYTLSKALGISPLEVYKMPSSLVSDLLMMVNIQNELEAKELEKAKRGI